MVEPNTATDIAVQRVSMIFYLVHLKCHDLFQKVKIKREHAPYGKCITTWAETGMNQHAFEIDQGFILPYTCLLYTSDAADE